MGMSEGTKTLPTISIFDLANKKRLASVNLRAWTSEMQYTV
jgi:hypothetical protein